MDQLLQITFWLSVAGLAYLYAGYPLLVWCLGRGFPRSAIKKPGKQPISIVIVAHNEAQRLPGKVAGLLQSRDADCIAEILIGSDGSTDATSSVAQASGDPRVSVVSFPERRGKPAVLNDLIPRCKAEIVLLADARQEFDAAAIGALIENFNDPAVGVVSGELVLRKPAAETSASQGIGFYWTYEKFIRKSESRFRGVPGATGACYAIRKRLFRPIHPATILDDVAIPLQAVEQGYRCLFEPAAVVYDEPSSSPTQEAIRKRRTISGNAQLAILYPRWLCPWRSPLWFEFVSHKLLRLGSPLLLAAALLSNAWLLKLPLYQLLGEVQGLCYLAAGLGWLAQRRGWRSPFCGPFLMFVTLNWSTGLALWDSVRGNYRVTWRQASSST